jgi:diguanylate cyclase (GGDEF)-like protein
MDHSNAIPMTIRGGSAELSRPDLFCQRPEYLRAILKVTRLAILMFGSDGECLCASQAALDLFGASCMEDLPALSSPQISPTLQSDGRTSRQKWQELLVQVRSQGSLAFEWEMLRADGSPMVARFNLTYVAEEDLLHCSIDDITDLKLAQSRLEFLAYHDPVTSLPNTNAAQEQLGRQLLRLSSPAGCGVISLGLIGFQEFNDAYGYSMGDRLLKQVASYLVCSLTTEFTVYRATGPEFLLLVAGIVSDDGLVAACQQLANLGGHRLQIEDVEFDLHFKLGASRGPQDSCDAAKLIRQASLAREHARRDESRPFRLYQTRMSDELLHGIQIRQALNSALIQQQFELYYQPQIDLTSGSVTGVEALIRWNRPGHGLIAPGAFIGAAEDSGLIRPIGRWVLREACRQSMQWASAGHENLRIAVNLSAVQFRHEGIRWDVLDALEESGLPASCLELELTESLLLADGTQVATTLSHWKSEGIQIAIDDFGTGYSSLSYLKRLSVDKLKIDRSFIHDFMTDRQDRSIVRAILQMARSLGIQTIAEGIESADVAAQLARMGCEIGQGYWFGRPLPAKEFKQWLELQQVQP